jgi:hypothetical protein
MYRIAIEKLKQWKQSSRRKPLIIEGGKTGRQNLAHESVRENSICGYRIH